MAPIQTVPTPTNLSSSTELYKMTPLEPSCRVCGKNERPKKCSRCSSVAYCSRDCQKTDWVEHKKTCRVPSSLLPRTPIEQVFIYDLQVAPSTPLPTPPQQIISSIRTIHSTVLPLPTVLPTSPSSIVVYLGLVGDPRVPTKHKLFRVLLSVPKSDIAHFHSAALGTLSARCKVTIAIVQTAADVIGGRTYRICVEYGEEAGKYKHLVEFYYDEDYGHSAWDTAVIWCGGIKECENRATKLAFECGWRNVQELRDEMENIFDAGCVVARLLKAEMMEKTVALNAA